LNGKNFSQKRYRNRASGKEKSLRKLVNERVLSIQKKKDPVPKNFHGVDRKIKKEDRVLGVTRRENKASTSLVPEKNEIRWIFTDSSNTKDY